MAVEIQNALATATGSHSNAGQKFGEKVKNCGTKLECPLASS